MSHVDHAPRVASVEYRAGLVPGALIGVLDAEGFDLEPDDACEVCLDVLVVQNGEPEVVVEEELDLRLALVAGKRRSHVRHAE